MISYRYDSSADALDIRLRDAAVACTQEIDSGTLVDLDDSGDPVAIEVLRPARRWPLGEILERYDIDEEAAEMLRLLWGEPRSNPFGEPAGVGAGSAAGDLVRG